MARVHLLAIAIVACVRAPVYAQADVTASLAILTEPQFYMSTTSRADVEEGQTLDVPMGDPLSLRLTIENSGDADSRPTVTSLDPHFAPVGVFVVYPDGSEHIVEALHVNSRAAPPKLRPIRPGEIFVLDTYLFRGALNKLPRGKKEPTYVFPEEGLYEVYFEYVLGDPADCWRFQRGEIQEAPPVVRSNRVSVRVGPPIAGWQQLLDADILRFGGYGDWPALQDAESPINATIDAANRPWLSEWRDHLLVSRRDD